jgi:Domain of unknown function (DUF5658)
MTAEAYAHHAPIVGTVIPTSWNRCVTRSLFGDISIILFLLAQCFDGIFTYIGVLSFGAGIEANPIITALMSAFGDGPAVTGAKMVAGALGICLHVREVHGAVALLAVFYMAVAIVPWTAILFF